MRLLKLGNKIKIIFCAFVILVLCAPFVVSGKTQDESIEEFSEILTHALNKIKSKIVFIKKSVYKSKQNHIKLNQYESINTNKSGRITIFEYNNTKTNYKCNLRESFNTQNKIRFVSFVDNEGIEYFYNVSRGKFEIDFTYKGIAFFKDKDNNISLTFGDDYTITRTLCGKISLSDNLSEAIFTDEDFKLRQITFDAVLDNFPDTEYAKLIPIFRKNIDFKKYITGSINLYRGIISERPLNLSDNLVEYADNRIKYFVENKIIPAENSDYETPYLKGFSGISASERKTRYGIEHKVFDINEFYKDPIDFVTTLFENLDYRAELLSLNAVDVGVSYSKEHNLACIVISHNESADPVKKFRVFPPHDSKDIRPAIMYPSGSLRAYPVSLHIDGLYDDSNTVRLMYTETNEQLDFTKGKFYGNNTRYVIGKKEFKQGQTYSVEFGFTNLYKPIKSIRCCFDVMKLDEFSKYDIAQQLYKQNQ